MQHRNENRPTEALRMATILKPRESKGDSRRLQSLVFSDDGVRVGYVVSSVPDPTPMPGSRSDSFMPDTYG